MCKTQVSTATETQPRFGNSDSEQRSEPLDRAAVRTHGRTDRPRLLRSYEPETHWRVSVVPFGMDRARAIEHAEDALCLAVWPRRDAAFYLRDVTGGVELWMRGPGSDLWLAAEVAELLDRLGPDVWP